MGLTALEKEVGRTYRAECIAKLDEINRVDPPTFEVPFFLGIYRHLCTGRNNRSMALELKEKYWASPIYSVENVAAGRFGFIFREGKCRACGQTARSPVGWLVDGHERPPITGRVARS